MTATAFTTSDNATVKKWTDRLYTDLVSDANLLGECISDGIIQVQNELSSGSGDRVRVFQQDRLRGKPRLGMQAREGYELALTYFDHDILIDEIDIPVKIPAMGTIDAQRVDFNLPENSYEGIYSMASEFLVVSMFNQLAGFTATSFTYDSQTYTSTDYTLLTGMNAASAPSTNRVVYPTSALTTDQGVQADTTATFRLTQIDTAEALAMKVRPYIKSIGAKSSAGEIMFKCFIHPDTFNQLKQDTTSPIQYRDIFLGNVTSGKTQGIINAPVYSRTMFVITDKVPNGVHSGTGAVQSNVRRAILCGLNAGTVAFGQGYTAMGETTPGITFIQSDADHKKYDVYVGQGIWGLRKNVFNSIDAGTVVLPHYVA